MQRVLVVDDDELILEWFLEVFDEPQLSIRQASNGTEAIAALRKEAFDLMITDIVMPGKGGIEALMEIRKDSPNLKIIIMSGKVDTDADAVKKLAEQYKAESVLRKPLQLEQVLTEVYRVLAA